jgi:hypothetical protein
MESLRKPIVLEPQWFAMSEADKDLHFACDAKIAEAIRLILVETQHSRLYKFDGNRANPPYLDASDDDEGDEGDAARIGVRVRKYAPGYDHNLTQKWPSPGRDALDYLRNEFAGKKGDKKAISELAERLSEVSLSDHRGNAEKFATEYRLRERAYLSAVENSPSFSVEQHNADQVRFITSTFKKADKSFYQWEINVAKANPDELSPDEVLSSFVLKCVADRRSEGQARGRQSARHDRACAPFRGRELRPTAQGAGNSCLLVLRRNQVWRPQEAPAQRAHRRRQGPV